MKTEVISKYHNDPHFHQLVDAIASMLAEEKNLTVHDMHNAVDLAKTLVDRQFLLHRRLLHTIGSDGDKK